MAHLRSECPRTVRAWLAPVLIAALFLAPGAAADPSPFATASQTDGPLLADIDLNDVTAESALRLLAELYNVSIATGPLPETRITVRLRNVGVEEALGSVAIAARLEVKRHGSVVLVSAGDPGGEARQIVTGPFPPGAGTGGDWLGATGVEVRMIGDAALLEGPADAVQAVAAALVDARRGAVADRVFHLGVAPGEETLQAVQPLLEPNLESASYDATGHLLTVSALPTTLGRLESLVGELSRSPTQYEIEVKVVEVSRNALKRMGAQGFFRLEMRAGQLSSTYPLTGLDDSSRYFPSPNDLATISNTASQNANVNQGAEPGSLADPGFRFGQIDGRGIGLLIEFLEQSGEARVMATPRVTALDNRLARISMVTTLRIPTFTQNAAFATTTVSGIEEIDVGTTLEVRPRRGKGREILLTVKPEVSELLASAEAFSQSGLTQGLPVVARRRTETEVILESGETLVIGGLVREREEEVVGKTPGLGNIPVIGRAFKHKGKDSASSELLVFVTPRELPSPEERRAKVRVDELWLPAGLAAQVDAARGLAAAASPAQRVAGVRGLERIDGELREEGLDVGSDVVFLGADPSLEVRVAAALFLLRQRPAAALGELVRFADSRAVALSALAAPMAPHLNAALAELVAHSDGGTELLARRLQSAIDTGGAATSHLLEALSSAAPERAAAMAAQLEDPTGSGGVVAATRQLSAFGSPGGPAKLLASSTPVSMPDSLALGVRELEVFATLPLVTEPALAWSGSPGEIEISGAPADIALVREALGLLAGKAPDLRHLVAFALSQIEIGAITASADPERRIGYVANGAAPEQLAHRLVRLATIVFESRVRGFPPASGHSLARAVRQEIRALERLTGAPCAPDRVESIVQRVLLAVNLEENGDAIYLTH